MQFRCKSRRKASVNDTLTQKVKGLGFRQDRFEFRARPTSTFTTCPFRVYAKRAAGLAHLFYAKIGEMSLDTLINLLPHHLSIFLQPPRPEHGRPLRRGPLSSSPLPPSPSSIRAPHEFLSKYWGPVGRRKPRNLINYVT